MRHFDTMADDDDRFIGIVHKVVESSMLMYSPDLLKVVRIDNWFGQRWRGFAGKTLGALGVSRGRLVIPPFVPSRVNSEDSWKKSGNSYSREATFVPLHKRIPSEDNLRRYFDQYWPETIAVWFSSRSKSNGRGSIMLYSDVRRERTTSWYVELAEAKSWQPTLMNGISAQEFESLLARNPEKGGGGSSAALRASP